MREGAGDGGDAGQGDLGSQGLVRGRPAPQAEGGKYGAGEKTGRDEAAGRSALPPSPSGCTP